MYRINNTTHLNKGGQNSKSLRALNNTSAFFALTLSLAVISMTFLSCSNLAGGASDNAGGGTPADSQIILCTGNISTSGAVSENVADILSSAVAPTSATSSAGAAGSDSVGLISAAAPTVQNTYTYFAEATYEGLATPVTGSFNNTSNPTEFGIALAAGKTWTITCGIKNTEGDIVLSDSYPDFTPTAANPVINHTFMLQFNGSGTGSISLKINRGTSLIEYVTATCSATGWKNANGGNETVTLTFSGGATTLSVPSIQAGTYEVAFNFYSVDHPEETGELIKFSTVQTITVADGMVTKTWLCGKAAPVASSEVISATGEDTFNITNIVINAARRNVFYVGSRTGVTGLDTNDGSASSPFATITQACKYIAANGISTENYKIYVNGTATGSHEVLSMVSGNAASLSIIGYRGLDSTGVPQDVLDGGFTTNVIEGVVLKLGTTVPVTIKNLKITGGFPRSGSSAGGIYIWNTPTTLENCVITGNKTYGMSTPTDFCAGVRLAAPATSFTLKGKNIIKDNFKVGEDGIPYPANLYVGNSTRKIKISGNITGSEIGINVPYSGTSVPTAAAPKVFTENYRYGTTNTALPGTIFTAENGYGITAITSGTNAGEAAFAVSSGGMYTYEDFNFGFAAKESAEAGAANVTQIFPGEARTVYIMPASLKRKESGGSDTDLYYNSTDKKLYLASDHSVKAAGDNALEITAALYNGGYKVCDLTTVACEGGRSVEIPSQSLPGTYVLKVNYTYLGVTKEVNINLDCTTDGVAYGLSHLAALPAGGGSLALSGTLSADDFTALNTAIKARYTANSSFRVDLDLSGVTELTEIPAEAFRDNDALKTVVLPDGITSIGSRAFNDCSYLKTINLPDGLTEIGSYAFYWCPALRDVTFPDTLTSIGDDGLNHCHLTEVILPEGLTSLGRHAFASNTYLQSVTIPSTLTTIPYECFFNTVLTTVTIAEGVENIDNDAFWCCYTLTSIDLPSTIKSIDPQAFDTARNLAEINIAGTNTVYKSIDGVVYKYNTDGSLSLAIYPNAKGTSYAIPADANVTSIEREFCYWLNEVNDLVEFTIPVSVTKINREAFRSCGKLTTLNYSGSTAQWNAITKLTDWKYGLGATVVHCSDGNVEL